MTCAIRSELLQLVTDKRGREEGLDVVDADLLDDLERWLIESDVPTTEGEPRKRDYRSDGSGPIPKGRKLPSVTGILGILGFSKEAIARWAAREAAAACAEMMMQGAAPDDAAWRAKFEPFNRRDEKGEGGTLAHGLIEAYLKGVEPEIDPFLPSATVKAARGALDRFRGWWDRGEYEAVHVELALVDQRLGYGGTMDSILRRRKDGALIVGDLKTGKGVYDDQILQLGGYTCLARNVANLDVTEGLLIHVPLDPVDYDRRIVPIDAQRLALGASLFAALFWIYANRKQLSLEGGK
jgi:hypothetical protein